MSFIECNCTQVGSLDGNCNDTTGKCACKVGFDGDKCNRCDKGYSEFPNCEKDTSLAIIIVIVILIVILVLLFVFGYRRYFFQLII